MSGLIASALVIVLNDDSAEKYLTALILKYIHQNKIRLYADTEADTAGLKSQKKHKLASVISH